MGDSMRAAAAGLLFLVAPVPGALAQPAKAPVESVTVTGLKGAPQQVVDRFVKSFAAPSYLTGKMGRWENGICPVTVGLGPKFTAFITARVRALAGQVGAPVDANPSCRANIEIAFTTTPQALLDEVRKNHKNYLGYHEGSKQADKLAVVSHPIQAWYMTATKDLDGKVEVDAFNLAPLEPIRVPCTSCTIGYLELYVPGGAKKVTGGRLKDGLRTIFHHIIIAADPAKLTDFEMGPLADYIAMLSLTQLSSLDVCQQLPSVISLLAKDCPGAPSQISESDLGYLRGLYSMSADGNLRVQQDGIAYQMQQNFKGQ